MVRLGSEQSTHPTAPGLVHDSGTDKWRQEDRYSRRDGVGHTSGERWDLVCPPAPVSPVLVDVYDPFTR